MTSQGEWDKDMPVLAFDDYIEMNPKAWVERINQDFRKIEKMRLFFYFLYAPR